jgi:transposase
MTTSSQICEIACWAVKSGKKSQAEIAETFGISFSTLEKWWHRWRETGRNTALPQRAVPPRTLAERDDLIRTIIDEQSDVTLDELCARIAERRGVVASRSMMCRTLQHLDRPRKKVAPRQRARHDLGKAVGADVYR